MLLLLKSLATCYIKLKLLKFELTPYWIGSILKVTGGTMTRTFIQTPEFSRNWDSLGFDDDDLLLLEIDIMEHPDKYPVMKGTGGLRKARISLDDNNKGKSGGARVCFVDFVFAETVYLITVYPKKAKDNLSKEERNEIKKVIEALKKSLGGE